MSQPKPPEKSLQEQITDELIRLFGPKPDRSPQDNQMGLGMLRGWREAAMDPRREYATPEDRALEVNAATEALKRLGVKIPPEPQSS